nr:very low-density lipoprotein receptor-like isoform X8 [Hydra vulgaris]
MMLVKCNFFKSIFTVFCLVYVTKVEGQTTQITTPTRTTTDSVCLNEFQCFNGECIPLNWKCDHDDDCSDLSDEDPSICRTTEKKTPTRTTTFSVCSSDYFQCSNGKCIPLNWKCDDYYDCSDHSDEDPSICSRTTQITTPTKTTTFSGQITQSPTKTRTTKTETVFGRTTQITTPTRTTVFSVCSSDHFQCFSGKCIPLNWKCDDYYDCSDHSDEDPSICGRTTEITTLTRSTTFFECLSNQFQCFNGECIPLYLKCNGYYNCFDRSDEDPSICDQTTQSPPTTPTTKTATVFVCANDHFQCSNGKCILRHRKCNGVFDCSDYSDEDQYTCDQNTQSPLIAPTTRTISNFECNPAMCKRHRKLLIQFEIKFQPKLILTIR